MKVRKGFVSNSSSSSFIVAFPKDMEVSSDSVQNYMFNGQEFVTAYDWIGTFGAKEIADRVVRDMRDQKPNDAEAIIEAMGGHLPGSPSLDRFRVRKEDGKGFDYDCEAYEKASSEFRAQMLEKLKKEFEGMDIFTFEYSDNDGNFFCTMEHGGIFDNVPHLRISNH